MIHRFNIAGNPMERNMVQQSKPQKETVKRVMHEYKHGELKSRGNGPKVKNPKQAVAIALHEAGATNRETPKKNRRNFQRTKAKEARGQTAQAAETEGKNAQERTLKSATDRGRTGAAKGQTRKALYAMAQKQHIAGRSKMSKADLERAVRR
jgi:hypothetical protein